MIAIEDLAEVQVMGVVIVSKTAKPVPAREGLTNAPTR